MPMPVACNVLRKSGSGELVVAADFAATGRTTATFHDLVDRLAADHTVWEIAPLPYGEEAGVTGAAQVDRWAADVRDSGLRVRAVVGFCGGNVYAAALAERVATWQDAPRLVLVDPGLPTPSMLVAHVEGWLRRYAAAFDEDALAEVTQTVPPAGSRPPLALAGALGAFFGAEIEPALVRSGHSPAASRDFTRLVNGYLHWLAGAMELDPRPLWASAPALNSNSPGFGLFLTPPEERSRLVGSATYFDVPHADMLRTPAVARAVDDLLA